MLPQRQQPTLLNHDSKGHGGNRANQGGPVNGLNRISISEDSTKSILSPSWLPLQERARGPVFSRPSFSPLKRESTEGVRKLFTWRPLKWGFSSGPFTDLPLFDPIYLGANRVSPSFQYQWPPSSQVRPDPVDSSSPPQHSFNPQTNKRNLLAGAGGSGERGNFYPKQVRL